MRGARLELANQMATEPKSAASTTSAILATGYISRHYLFVIFFKETQCTTDFTKLNLNTPTKSEENAGYARRGTRTLKSVQTADFKSAMFTNFIILANP